MSNVVKWFFGCFAQQEVWWRYWSKAQESLKDLENNKLKFDCLIRKTYRDNWNDHHDLGESVMLLKNVL